MTNKTQNLRAASIRHAVLSSILAIATLFSVVHPVIGATNGAPVAAYVTAPSSAPVYTSPKTVLAQPAPLKVVTESGVKKPATAGAIADHPDNINHKAPFRLLPQIQTNAPLSTTCTTITVTNSSTTVGQPAISGIGNRVSFWSIGALATDGSGVNPDGNVEVFLADLSGGANNVKVTQVTSSTGSILGGFNLWPSVSGDGTRVAFASDRNLSGGNLDGNFEIFVADASSSGAPTVTQVTTTTVGVNTTPSMSSDGNHVAFVSNNDLILGSNPNKSTEIYLATLTGTTVLSYTQLTFTGLDIVNDEPTINQDGTRVAYIARTVETATVLLLGTGSATPTSIGTSSLAVDNRPAISQDGKTVVFVSDYDLVPGKNPSGTAQAFLYVDGLGLTQLTQQGTNNNRCTPSISGNGLRVACVNQNSKIFLFNVRTGSSQQLSFSGNTYSDPQINSDGQSISYIQDGNLYAATCPVANLAINKSVTPITAVPGTPLQYTLVVTNYGPGTASNVIVSDALPAGIALASSRVPTQTAQDASTFDGTFLGTEYLAQSLHLKPPDTNYWELPDNGANTWTDMSGNTALLHLDDSTADTSPGLPPGISCPPPTSTCPIFSPGKLKSGYSYSAIRATGSSLPDSANSNFSALQDFTVMFWIRADPNQPATPNGETTLIEKYQADSGQTRWPFSIHLYNSASGNNGRIIASRYDRFWFTAVNSTRRIDDSLYHQVVFTRRGGSLPSPIIALYIDGQLEGSTVDNSGQFNANYCLIVFTVLCDTTNSSPVFVGVSYSFGSATSHLTGDLDEIALFSRSLPDTQISNIYSRQAAAYRYSGEYLSRPIDAGKVVNWSTLAWQLTQTITASRPLPDNGAIDATPPTANMTGNTLLLHLNEPAGSTTWTDTSPNHITGLFSGGGSRNPVMGGSGVFSSSASFSPANLSFLEIPDNGVLNTPFAVTVEAWVSTTNGVPLQFIAGKWQPGSGGYGLFIQNNLLVGRILNTNSFGIPTSIVQVLGSIPNNQWTHVAMTWRFTAGYNLYVNGNNVSTGSSGLFPINPANVNALVGYEAFNGNVFNGSIDELAIYNQELSASEIQQHYLRGADKGRGALQFQVRTCATQCTIEPFLGPNGQSNTYYTRPLNEGVLSYSTPLTITPNQFFQYKTDFNFDDFSLQQKVISITVGPPHGAADPTQGQCNLVSPIICNLGTLQNGRTATVTIATQVQNNVSAGDVSNSANVTSDADDIDPTDNVATATTFIQRNVVLSLAKLVTPTTINGLNQLITYTLVVTNEGTSSATNVSISDTLPADFNPRSIIETATDGSSLFTCPPLTTRPLTCSLAVLPGQTTTYIQITGIPLPNTSGSIVNTAAVTATEFPSVTRSTATVNVPVLVDIGVSESLAPSIATAGSPITYTFTVSNAVGALTSNVVLSDTLDGNVTYVAATPSASCLLNNITNVVRCNTGSLGSGASKVITITGNVLPSTLSPVTNNGAVTTSDIDLNPANNTSSATTPVQTRAHLRLTKTAASNVSAGTILVYTITAVNDGPSDAQGVAVTDVLPAGATFLSSRTIPAATQPTPVGSVITWLAPTVPAAASYTIFLTVSVTNQNPPLQLTNVATATSTTIDPAPGSNSDSALTTVTPTGPGSVLFTAPTNCVINIACTLTASVSDPNATLPMTFIWTADGQTTITNTVNALTNNVTFIWTTGGTKNIGIIADNVAPGNAEVTNQPVVVITPITSVQMTGPIPVCARNTACVFTATVSPANATLPVTYTWSTTNVTPPCNNGCSLNSITNSALITWAVTGTQSITVTVTDVLGNTRNDFKTLTIP